MDSGPVVCDDSKKKQLELLRWGKSPRVYTRKYPKKSKNTNAALKYQQQPQESLQTVITRVDDQSSLQLEPLDESSRHSDNHPSQPPVTSEDDGELPKGTGLQGYTCLENRVRINLCLMRRNDALEIRHKLINELDQVRILMKRLEARESETNGYCHSQLLGSETGCKVWSKSRVDLEADPVEQNLHTVSGVSASGNNHGVVEYVQKERRLRKASPCSNFEYLPMKDMFSPPKPKKKLKANVGKGHGVVRGIEWMWVDKTSKLFKRCSSLLRNLIKHEYGWVFDHPVDVEGLNLYDYFTIIKNPMDLGTVRSRLSSNWYKSPREFAKDVRRTFRNAMIYNPKGQDVHHMAERLLKIFEDNWAFIESEFDLGCKFEMWYDTDLRTATSRTTLFSVLAPAARAPPHHLQQGEMTLDKSEPMVMAFEKSKSKPLTASYREEMTLEISEAVAMAYEKNKSKPSTALCLGKGPIPEKPKAMDLNNRNMTYKEKQKLSANLQSLPQNKLNDVVEIIQRGNTDLSKQDDEIEVDIDTVNPETLWELYRYVINYKKSLSKKRKADTALHVGAEAGHDIQLTNPTPPTAEVSSKAEIAQEFAASSDRVRRENQGYHASESSSSSSSCSDSESSSSDSDSDSSSGDGSDGDQYPCS